MRIFLAVLLFLFLGCGGDQLGTTTSSIEFSPNPAETSGNVCESEASVLSLSDRTVSLVALAAEFEGSQGRRVSFSRSAEELSQTFDSLILTGNSLVQATFTFDFSNSNLEFPVQGSVVLVGAGVSGVTHFVGLLRCEVV